MTVPAGLRSESKLVAQQKTEDMIAHTVRITSNQNVFNPTYHVLVDRVLDTALGIGMDLWEANGIMVRDDPAKWATRRALQERACRSFDTLLYLATLCRRTYHLRSGKFHAWINMITEARDYARKWRDSDARRYGRLQSG